MTHQMKAVEMEFVETEVPANAFEYWSGPRLLPLE